MHYGAMKKVDIADGPGVRVALYVSGCTRHCEGCHNAVAWPFEYGKPYDGEAQKALLEALKPYWVKGLSILGGEPLEPANLWDVYNTLLIVRNECPDKDVWIYTGYTWEELLARDGLDGRLTGDILKLTDVLVDGPFIEEQKDITLRFRGSRNQRIIDVQKSLCKGRPEAWYD